MVWNRLTAWFRQKFSATSDQLYQQPSQLGPVSRSELVTRFIASSDHYAATKGRVKPAALTPSENSRTGRLELSVYRAEGLPGSELWSLCEQFVDSPTAGRRMKARATCSAQSYLDHGLEFDADGRPHPRHANVTGWPAMKSERMLLQQKVAADMTLELRS